MQPNQSIGLLLMALGAYLCAQRQEPEQAPSPAPGGGRDSDLIDALGGCTRVAERLRMDRRRGAQRVCNWRKRGIPARVKLAHPDIFLAGTVVSTAATAAAVPQGEGVRDAA